MSESAPAPSSVRPPLHALGPRARRAVVGLVIALWVLGLCGTVLLPWLLANAPLGLILLTPALQHVVLTTPLIDPAWLIGVATARRVLSLLSIFWLGGLYGPRVVRWIESRSARAGTAVRFFEACLRRFGLFAMVVLPIHSISALAGAVGMKTVPFVFAVSLGQFVHLWVTVAFGEVIAGWTAPLIALITGHIVPATAVCAALVVGHLVFGRWRTGRWGFALRLGSDSK